MVSEQNIYRRQAVFVLGRTDGIFNVGNKEREVWCVELGEYLCKLS